MEHSVKLKSEHAVNQVSFLLKVFPWLAALLYHLVVLIHRDKVGFRASAAHYSVIADNLPSLVWVPVIHSEP